MLQLSKLSYTGSEPTCLVSRTIITHDTTSHLVTARASDSVILRHCARYKSTYHYYYCCWTNKRVSCVDRSSLSGNNRLAVQRRHSAILVVI